MKHKPKIYVLGASCSGVTTLGTALSERLGISQIDVDDFYWMPTDPPFSIKRPPKERVRMIKGQQSKNSGWVLSGSFMGWGDTLIDNVDLIVFLYTPPDVRLRRLDRREAHRYGDRILPGGDMHEAHLAFRNWAAGYDDPAFKGRNLWQHEDWLRKQSAPIVRIKGEQSVEKQLSLVVEKIFQ